MEQNTLQISQHVNRRNPQGHDPMQFQPRITIGIKFRLIAHAVRFTVDFNAELCVRAIEIEYIKAAGMLLAEFDTAGAEFEFTPQQPLRQRHFLPQRPRADYQLPITLQHDLTPPRNGEVGRDEADRRSTDGGAVTGTT
jgi:hypothetical protein